MPIVLDKGLEFKTVCSFYTSFYAHMQAQTNQLTNDAKSTKKEIFLPIDCSKVRLGIAQHQFVGWVFSFSPVLTLLCKRRSSDSMHVSYFNGFSKHLVCIWSTILACVSSHLWLRNSHNSQKCQALSSRVQCYKFLRVQVTCLLH